MKRLLTVVILLGVIAIIIIPFAGSDSLASNATSERHVFTWISHVTPQLARWAKGMHFTDVICSDNSVESYQNLWDEGITYWYVVTAHAINSVTLNDLQQQLHRFANSSPNAHIYLDDPHRILLVYGLEAMSSLLDAVRCVEREKDARFILDGYPDPRLGNSTGTGYRRTSRYLEDEVHIDRYADRKLAMVDWTGVDLDLYQRLDGNYTALILQFIGIGPRSLGFYVWAFGCCGTGISWDTVSRTQLESVYTEAIANNASRVVVWNGYSKASGNGAWDEACVADSSLYYYPEWWDIIRSANLAFLEE